MMTTTVVIAMIVESGKKLSFLSVHLNNISKIVSNVALLKIPQPTSLFIQVLSDIFIIL